MSAIELRFGWWNTGGGRKDADAASVVRVIEALISTHGLHVLILGEFTNKLPERLQEMISSRRWQIIPMDKKFERSRFDLAAICASPHVTVGGPEYLVHNVHKHIERVGVRLDCSIPSAGLALDLWGVHWPSDLVAGADAERDRFASRLRAEIEVRAKQNAYVLIVGDLNAEPSSRAVEEHLQATRDRTWALKRRRFYNPTWRLLGAGADPLRLDGQGRFAGSFRFDNPPVYHPTRWRTVDQVLVSPGLLDGDWQLVERDLQLGLVPDLLDVAGHLSEGYDHIPLVGTIRHFASSPGATRP